MFSKSQLLKTSLQNSFMELALNIQKMCINSICSNSDLQIVLCACWLVMEHSVTCVIPRHICIAYRKYWISLLYYEHCYSIDYLLEIKVLMNTSFKRKNASPKISLHLTQSNPSSPRFCSPLCQPPH